MAEWSKAYKREQRIEWRDVANAIREAVTVEEVLTTYCPGIRVRNHRCPCPIHHGRDYNMSFTEHGYTCFVCGSSGDVIDLVKEVCELSTRSDAMKRINQDMRLNLPLAGEAATAQQSAEIRKRREEAEAKMAAIEAWNARYNRLWDEWAELDKRIRSLDKHDPELATATERITRIEYQLDNLPEEPR